MGLTPFAYAHDQSPVYVCFRMICSSTQPTRYLTLFMRGVLHSSLELSVPDGNYLGAERTELDPSKRAYAQTSGYG